MASTVQQYNAASQTLNNSIQTADDDLASLTAEVKAIQANPTQPNAQQKLDILKERADAVTGGVSADVQGKRYELVQVYNNLPPSDQAQLSNQLVQSSQATNNIINQTQILRGDLLVAQNAVSRGVASDFTQKGTEDNKKDDDSSGPTEPPSTGPVKKSPRARKNPLGDFASSTYQLTLYMITPDAYDAFVQSGRKNINAFTQAQPVTGSAAGGAFIVAQSGGTNEKYRLKPEFQYDYYIDNLVATTYNSGSELNTFNIKFTIIEPYGFSFITNLRRARDKLETVSKGTSILPGPERNLYILGFRFYGYDETGNILTGKERMDDGTILDPNNSNTGLFEKFIDIQITDFTFKLDGKATVYNIAAGTVGQEAGLGLKRGTFKHGVSLTASTVEEAIGLLKEKLNKDEEQSIDTEPRNRYDFQFIGEEEDIKRIKNASLIAPNDKTKGAWEGSRATKTSEVNENTSVKAAPSPVKHQFAQPADTIVNDVVAMLMKQSNYMTSAVNTLYEAQTSGKVGKAITNNPGDQQLNWYNLSCEVKNARFNTKLNDWVYDITYVIQPYKTPAVYTPLLSTNPTYSFYGPHKTYEYYFTGQNTEVLSYEQTYNLGYFNAIAPVEGLPSPGFSNRDYSPPMATGKRPDVSRVSSLNKSLDTQNTILTVLYDPGAQISGKLTIMGDPDFLMTPNPSSLNQVYDQFYGSDGYTINPNGGQIFITVDFKEAIDYDLSNGYLNVNQNVFLIKYPPEIAKAYPGVIFQVIELTSTFNNGKFTQVISVALPPLWNTDEEGNERSDSAKEAAQGSKDKENIRVVSPNVNYIYPATSGATPGQNNSSKSSNQLAPDLPPTPTATPSANDLLNPVYFRSTGATGAAPPASPTPPPAATNTRGQQGEALYDPQTGQSLGYADFGTEDD